MKKLLALLMAVLMLAGLMACGAQNGEDTEDKTADGAPEEKVLGALVADHPEDVDLDEFGQVFEAMVDTADVEVVLHTDGRYLRDVMVESGAMDSNGVVFEAKYPVFKARELGPDTAVVIHTPMYDTAPALRLQLTGENGQDAYFLLQSGQDSSYLIVPASEFK